MAILCIEEAEEAKRWQSALKRELPDADIRIWPDVGEPKDIRMVVLWDEVDQINALPNLQAAVILGAGIEHLLPHVESIPAAVKIIRLVDKSITSQMLEWVTLAVLTRTRFWDEYRDLQRHKRYEELVPPAPSEVTVGIMGLGVLGRETAQLLAAIGYTVMGWSPVRENDGRYRVLSRTRSSGNDAQRVRYRDLHAAAHSGDRGSYRPQFLCRDEVWRLLH